MACGGTTIGKKGMHLASRVLAAMAWDLFHDAKLVEEAKAEYRRRLMEKRISRSSCQTSRRR